eukprot:2089990-Pyramimonas_sp.AAC.1
MMGPCLPWQEAHKGFRAQYAETWGYRSADLEALRTKLAEVIHHTSTLATFAHHHEVAGKYGCPKTWAGIQAHNFTLEAPLRVLEAI